MAQGDNEVVERRSAIRLDMEKTLVDISWCDEQAQVRNKKVICVDFSRQGIKLDSDQALTLDSQVSIVIDRDDPLCLCLNGKVIRCIKQANGWFEIALLWGAKDKELMK